MHLLRCYKCANRPRHEINTLIKAAEEGHLEIIQVLVGAGASINKGTTDQGATPLLCAAAHGRFEAVRFLVESRASIDQAKTDTGVTPLYIAAAFGTPGVLEFLVKSGANINQANTHGTTPLDIAIRRTQWRNV